MNTIPHTQDNADHHGKADDGGDGAAGGITVFRSQLTACQHRRAGGKNVLNGYHNQQKRNGNAHRRQGNIRPEHADVGSIHQIVNRLCKQRQGGGDRQLHNGLGRRHVSQDGLGLGFLFGHFGVPSFKDNRLAGLFC